MRDHQPIELSNFKGLWQRGDTEEVPSDHFSDCDNIRFVGSGSFATRFGIDRHQNVAVPLGKVVRIYNYITSQGSTLLALTWDGTDGKIYHVVDSTTVFGPILTIAGMIDFGFIPYAGRAYITPFKTYVQGGLNVEKGMENQFLYVYLGAGAPARKAGGNPPTGQVTVANGAVGNTDAGFHLFGVVFETDTGFLTAPAAFRGFTTSANLSVTFTTIPISLQSHITKRHIVATKKIVNYNGDTTGYQYFFIPGATLNDNVTTTLANISFFDIDLLEDASHLLDNYALIPAGVGLCIYHNRLCLYTTFTDISIVLVSEVGEPEAIDQIDGLLIVPPDGNPITNAQEMRDVLYVFKRVRTVSFVDNGGEPATWPLTAIDEALGCPVHGIATVIDSGASSVDYLMIATYQGITLFNGKYSQPELSWKIRELWFNLDRNIFRLISLLNDPINQILYCTTTDYRLLIGNYANGLDPQNVRWTPNSFDVKVNAVALVNIDQLIIAAEGRRL